MSVNTTFFPCISAPNEEFPNRSKKAQAEVPEALPHFDSLRDWLDYYKLGKHEAALIKHGFDDLDFVGEDVINQDDLQTMGINEVQEKQDFLKALKGKGFSKGKTIFGKVA